VITSAAASVTAPVQVTVAVQPSSGYAFVITRSANPLASVTTLTGDDALTGAMSPATHEAPYASV